MVRYVPASAETEIGGDFYAALRTGEGVLTAVGDVVGHSLEAATVMVEIRHALRAYSVEESDPAVLAERLDRMLQRRCRPASPRPSASSWSTPPPDAPVSPTPATSRR